MLAHIQNINMYAIFLIYVWYMKGISLVYDQLIHTSGNLDVRIYKDM